MRDFAMEAILPPKVTVSQAVVQGNDDVSLSFWSRHIRITIEEVACRDHLGKLDVARKYHSIVSRAETSKRWKGLSSHTAVRHLHTRSSVSLWLSCSG